MSKFRFYLLALGLVLSSLTTAHAQYGLAAGAKIGTLGPGLELTGYLGEEVNFRIGGNYVSFGFDGEADDVNYDADLKFASVLATLDWHPFENNFRLSAGVCINNNELELSGTVDEATEIGDTTYTPEQIGELSGEATFDEVVPYIGIGYGNAVMDDVDLSFVFDLGVLFQGTADVELSSDGTLAGDPQFQADLKEEEDEAQDVADKIKIYPVLSFGIAYYFW